MPINIGRLEKAGPYIVDVLSIGVAGNVLPFDGRNVSGLLIVSFIS